MPNLAVCLTSISPKTCRRPCLSRCCLISSCSTFRPRLVCNRFIFEKNLSQKYLFFSCIILVFCHSKSKPLMTVRLTYKKNLYFYCSNCSHEVKLLWISSGIFLFIYLFWMVLKRVQSRNLGIHTFQQSPKGSCILNFYKKIPFQFSLFKTNVFSQWMVGTETSLRPQVPWKCQICQHQRQKSANGI